MVDYLKQRLTELGADVYEDNAGEYYNGSAGNIYACIKGDIEDSVLLSSHTDTVEPARGKRAVVDEYGKITSEGDTVLGADDISGLAAILEALTVIKENGLKHKNIELLLPIAEEVYVKGTNVFDFSKIKSSKAYVLDLSGKNGTAALKAPSLISFKAEVTGKAAHAGFEPQNGINAIAAVAEAVSAIKQGNTDEESTLNIGTISGGTASNIVSQNCLVTGELRSYNHSKALAMLEEVRHAFKDSSDKYGAALSFDYSVDLTAYNIEETSEVVREYDAACKALGIEPKHISTFGGSDNNNFVKNGIDGIVISCGYQNAHTTDEYTTVSELERTARIVLNLVI
jgi:tripeptide aminopeptidase